MTTSISAPAIAAIIAAIVFLAAISGAAAEKDYMKEVEISPDVVYDRKFGMPLTMDVLKPKKDANGAGIVYLFSGRWCSTFWPPEGALSGIYGAFFDFRPLLDKGFAVFIVRHGSGERFLLPEVVEDVRRSIRFIRANAQKFGVDPERLGAIGGSSGGHLALMLATTSDEGVPNPGRYDGWLHSSDRVAAVVAFYPPTDIRPWFENGFAKQFEAFRFDPKLAGKYSPLLLVTPKSAPTLLIHGDKDPVVPMEHSEKIQAEYKKNNVPCELVVLKGAGHGYFSAEHQNLTEAPVAAWFEKYLLAKNSPKKEVKAAELLKVAAAPQASLSRAYAVMDLSAGTSGPWPVSELDNPPADLLTNDAWRTTKMLLRKIPAATFKMGSLPEEPGAQDYANNYHVSDLQHSVTLTKPFYMGIFPVTQKQWTLVMGTEPSWFGGNPKRPVETVSWDDIRGGTWPNGSPADATFIGRIRAGASQSFDLPTEAQWEYACRAGTVRAFNDQTKNKGEGADCTDLNIDPLGSYCRAGTVGTFSDLTKTKPDPGLDSLGWYELNSEGTTRDVGGRQPNAWGFYDMHGNVSQWCLDYYAPYAGDATDPVGPEEAKRVGGRIMRGGYWSFCALGCRSSARNNDFWYLRFNVCGFRIVINHK